MDAGGKSAHFSRVLKRIIYFPQGKIVSAYANIVSKSTHSIKILICESGKCCVARSHQLLYKQNAGKTGSKWSLLHSILPFLGWQHNKLGIFLQDVDFAIISFTGISGYNSFLISLFLQNFRTRFNEFTSAKPCQLPFHSIPPKATDMN